MQNTTQRFSVFLFAAAALVNVAGCAATSTQKSTGQYMDDTDTTSISKALP